MREGATVLDPLREMFNYHYWATYRLIDHLATLSPERLDDTVPGTAGSIKETVVHLMRAERLYLSLMNGQGRPPHAPEDLTLTLNDLRSRFQLFFQQWETILDHIDDYDPTLPREGGEPPTPHVRNLLLTQAIHHGNDHRTHICTILGTTGQDVPDIDEWSYWFSDQHESTPA